MKGYFADIIKKHQETVATSGDKHTNSNNSVALMGLKNVSTDIIASSDRGDIKTMSPPVSPFVLKQETSQPAENLMCPLLLAVSMQEMKVIFERAVQLFFNTRTSQNKGAKTPGVDGIIWSSHQQKIEAARSLRRRGYKTKPLKRIYIKKKDGGKSSLRVFYTKVRFTTQ